MELNLITPLNQLGYGQVGINLVKELNRLCNLAVFPIGDARTLDSEARDAIVNGLTNAQMPNFYAPCIRIWHQHDMSQFVGTGPRIGFPIFELDRFTKQECHHLCNLDYIFVCSEWAKGVILNNLNNYAYMVKPEKVFVVPLGVTDYNIRQTESQSDKTKFFTCGKWEVRKGHDKLIEAFCRAFGPDDNVELNMMCSNPFLSEEQTKEWEEKYVLSDMGHRVRFISRVPEQRQVLEVMSSMDCGVFISRAEGWNLELLEMMSLGKQIIATNYSAHTEFCNSENSHLIEIDEMEDAVDDMWFHGQGKWAKLGDSQVDQVAQKMREVHENRSSNLVNHKGIETGKAYSWEQSAKKVLEHVRSF